MLLKKKLKKSLLVGNKRALTMFRPQIKSRHGSHSPLRRELPLMPFRSVIRLGSTTESQARVQLNSIQGVKNSSSKLLMKQCFTRAGVKTPQWGKYHIHNDITNAGICFHSDEGGQGIEFPIIVKGFYGSRGVANYKFDNKEQLVNWSRGKNLSNYIYEAFVKNMTREYRIHVTQEGSFYACRKLLRNGSPEGTWQMHEDVCVFILEENPSFKKPNNWNEIVADCVKAQKALGLDINSFDVMVSIPDRNGKCDWTIIESQSAPSLQVVGISKYKEILPKLLRRKHELPN